MQNGSRSYASGLNQKLVQNCSHLVNYILGWLVNLKYTKAAGTL